MLQLQPGEYTAIARQLADPNDSTTYYVRAVVRNARTNATIETVDLTDRGGQLFSKEWQVPSTTSDALYIIITTRVYTDSGYTTLSTDYGQELEMYLIETRTNHAGGGGDPLGGNKWKIDYEKFREIIREENKIILAAVIAAIPLDKMVSGKEVIQMIAGRFDSLQNGLLDMHGNVIAKLGAINVSPKVMLNEFLVDVREAAKVDNEALTGFLGTVLKEHGDVSKTQKEVFEQFSGELKAAIENMRSVYGMSVEKRTEAVKSLTEMLKLIEGFENMPREKNELPEWADKPASEIIKELRAGRIKK